VSTVIDVAWGCMTSQTWKSSIGKVLIICIWPALCSNVSVWNDT